MNMPPAKATVTNAMRLLATSEPDVFRQEVGVKIQPALQRLAGIELVSCISFFTSLLFRCANHASFYRILSHLAANGKITKDIFRL